MYSHHTNRASPWAFIFGPDSLLRFKPVSSRAAHFEIGMFEFDHSIRFLVLAIEEKTSILLSHLLVIHTSCLVSTNYPTDHY